jgi:hypothetical protein
MPADTGRDFRLTFRPELGPRGIDAQVTMTISPDEGDATEATVIQLPRPSELLPGRPDTTYALVEIEASLNSSALRAEFVGADPRQQVTLDTLEWHWTVSGSSGGKHEITLVLTGHWLSSAGTTHQLQVWSHETDVFVTKSFQFWNLPFGTITAVLFGQGLLTSFSSWAIRQRRTRRAQQPPAPLRRASAAEQRPPKKRRK